MNTRLSVVVVSGLVVLAGCNLVDPKPDQSVILSVPRIDAPATVSAGASFTVSLTILTGSCRAFSRLDVEKSNTGVHVIPWGKDASVGTDIVCLDNALVEEPHAIRIDPPFSGPFQVFVDQGRLGPVVATIQVR